MMNRDVPQMVQDYFSAEKIDLQKVLNDESERRGNSHYTRKAIFNKGHGSK